MRTLSLVLLSLAVASCSKEAEPEPAPTLDPPPVGEGFQLQMSGLAPAYTEVWLCEVYDIPIDSTAPVNWVQVLQNDGTHHMTLSTPGIGVDRIEPGAYNCEDLYGNASLMEDQIMFFGSQGLPEDELYLPEGVVASMPPGIQILHEVHYVNASDEDVELYSYVNAWTIPDDAVTDMIWGGQVRDEHIEIPAGGEATEWTRCVMNEDVDVLFLASHTHELGIEFTIAPFDGAETGEVFYSNDDWHNPLITQYSPPMHVPAGQGFEYACTWKNDGPEPVEYGLTSSDEMCNLALVFTPFSVSARCEVVESSDGYIWAP
jgi:hypothetical protein